MLVVLPTLTNGIHLTYIINIKGLKEFFDKQFRSTVRLSVASTEGFFGASFKAPVLFLLAKDSRCCKAAENPSYNTILLMKWLHRNIQ
jgi:hypothetical protein